MDKLPVPVTYEQMYLAAIVSELRAIRRKLGRNGPQRPALAEDEAIEVELQETEPVRAPRRRGKE
jgi:hypothetical protein